MHHKSSSHQGFSIVEALLVIVVVAAVGLTSWYVWHHTRHTNGNTTGASSANSANASAASGSSSGQSPQSKDPTESGKYLYIREWNVRVALPAAFQGKVAYTLQAGTDPDSGLPLQAATISVAETAFPASSCAVTSTTVGPSIQPGILYIRSSTAKPFNAARYKPTFKEDILVAGSYAYHLDYSVPSCFDSAYTTSLEALQTALLSLVSVSQ